MATMNRRDFLRTASVAGAAGVAACTYDPKTPVENVLPYVVMPEDELPGTANYFSTACTGCAAACGMVARSKEGRVVMVEGNPDHPIGRGLCVRGHMSLLAAYSPDRVEKPMDAGRPVEWDEAMARLKGAVEAARAAGKQVAWLGQYRTGSMSRLLEGLAGAMGLRRVHWEPLGLESLLAAVRTTFGMAAVPTYDLSGAHTILSFGMDFLGTAYGMMGMAEGWSKAKDPAQGGFVTRLVCVEPRVGVTSAQADHFLPPNPGTEALVAIAIARLAADKKGYTGPASSFLQGVDVGAMASASGISEEKLREVVDYLVAGPSVVLPGGFANGGTDATALAVATLLCNEVLGNVGQSVRFGLELKPGQVNSYAEVKALLDDARAGKIGVLFLDGANPVYSLPAADGAAEALDAVDLLVQLADETDDSTRPKTLLLPTGSGLETWGDGEFVAGVHVLQQPGMLPLKDTRSAGDVLLALAKSLNLAPPAGPAGAAVTVEAVTASTGPAADLSTAPVAGATVTVAGPLGFDFPDFATYVKARWAREIAPADRPFDAFWTEVRQKGVYVREVPVTGATVTLVDPPQYAAPAAGSDRALVVFPSPILGDGRHANRPWAQELPDPVSTNCWTSWVELNPKTVEQLGLAEGDKVKVTTPQGSIELGFFASRGVREDTVAVVLGNGHEGMGRYARGRGQNPMKLLASATDARSGAFAAYGARASVSRVGPGADTHELVGHIDQDGRKLANVVLAADAVAHVEGERGSLVHLHHIPIDPRLTRNPEIDLDRDGTPDMFPEPQHPTYRFALAVDTNACTGCMACVVACNLENNIPFVGPDQVRRGRTMNWLRMNRYWEGDGEHQDVRHMPAMCQQCSHAPCEGVCPVLATYHNLDGLNAMIYNRCVGTRYCANNCPYTARRFNYHTWTWPESMHLMLNPDVSVREMGVMEKCTFCVQRLRAVKDSWRDVKQTVPDEALQHLTACAAACPTGALTFGNAKDAEGQVAKKFESPRAYTLLGELNTKPGVRYLAKVRHHVDHGGQGGGHGAAAGGEHGAAPAHGGGGH